MQKKLELKIFDKKKMVKINLKNIFQLLIRLLKNLLQIPDIEKSLVFKF